MRYTGLFLALLALTACGAWGQAGNPLSGDPRFQRPISLAAKDAPMEAFLNDLRTRAGLPVRAEGVARDERITVFCRERPASEALAAVAECLDFTWQRDPSGVGFVLTQTPVQRESEQQQRNRTLAEQYAPLEKLATELASQGRMPREARRQRQISQLHEKIAATDPAYRAGLTRSLRALETGEFQGNIPTTDAFAIALSVASKEDWARLWQGEPFRFSYPASRGRTALTHEQAVDVARLQLTGYAKLKQPRLGSIYELPCDVTALRGELLPSITTEGVQVRLKCRFTGRRPEGETTETLEDALQGPSFGSEDNPPPLQGDFTSLATFSPPRVPQSTMSGFVEVLSATIPDLIVADSYSPLADVHMGLPDKGRERGMAYWLRMQCMYRKVTARRSGSTLFFRSGKWPLMRACQVPDRLYQKWVKDLGDAPTFTLDQFCEIYTTLSDAQLENFRRRLHLRPTLSSDQLFNFDQVDRESVQALRFLALLGPQRRHQLPGLSGQPFTFRQPTPNSPISGLIADFRGDSYDYERLLKAGLARPQSGLFPDEARYENGEPIGVRLWSYGVDFSRHPEAFEAWSLGRVKGSSTPFPPRPERVVNGSYYVLEIYPDPASKQFLFYTLWTSDLPAVTTASK